MDEESKNKLHAAFFDLRMKTMARQVVRNVASKAAKEATENMAKKNKTKSNRLAKGLLPDNGQRSPPEPP